MELIAHPINIGIKYQIMKSSTSIYLDASRLIAALIVFLSHVTSNEFNSTFPWVSIGHEAVVIFFVISGYVIAHVIQAREQSVIYYASARLGRLYSVVVPALILTWILDYIGREISPAVYQHIPGDHSIVRILISFLYLNQIWNFTVIPLSNGPFWSLGYEFWYYMIFGAWCLLKGKQRIILTMLFCIIAGPRILAAFPVWLIGVSVYYFSKSYQPTPFIARLIFVLSVICMISILANGNPLDFLGDKFQEYFKDNYIHTSIIDIYLGDMPKLPADGLLGVIFGLSILNIGFINISIKSFEVIGAAIRYLAGSTFSIYLFHAPLLYFTSALLGANPAAINHVVLTGSIALTCCFLLAYISERRLVYYRQFFLFALSSIWSKNKN